MELDKQNYKKVFEIYELLQEKLNYHLHIIIPVLCNLLTTDIYYVFEEFLIDAIKILETLSYHCSSMFKYSSLITNSVLFVMDKFDKLRYPGL